LKILPKIEVLGNFEDPMINILSSPPFRPFSVSMASVDCPE